MTGVGEIWRRAVNTVGEAVTAALEALDDLCNDVADRLWPSTAVRRAPEAASIQASSPRPPGGGESPAGPPPPLVPPGTTTAALPLVDPAGLTTSQLLLRSADLVATAHAFLTFVGLLEPDADAQLGVWAAELRSRATRFAASGD